MCSNINDKIFLCELRGAYLQSNAPRRKAVMVDATTVMDLFHPDEDPGWLTRRKRGKAPAFSRKKARSVSCHYKLFKLERR